MTHLQPGNSISTIIPTLITITKKNALAGIVLLFLYNLPSALFLMIVGQIFRKYPHEENLNILVLLGLYGMRSASVSNLLNLLVQMPRDRDYLSLIFTLSSVIFTLYYPNPQVVIFILVIGSLVMIMRQFDDFYSKKDEEVLKDEKEQEVNHDRVQYNSKRYYENVSQLFGSWSIHIYTIIFLLLLWLKSESHVSFQIIIDMTLQFFKIGSILILGTPIALPFTCFEMIQDQNIYNNYFWTGLALAIGLPGSYLNFVMFIGTYTGGIICGIFSWISVFIPLILHQFLILPQWNKLKSNDYFDIIVQGMSNIGRGLLISTIILCWKDAIQYDHTTANIIIIIQFVFIFLLDFSSTLVCLIAPTLFIARYLSLWYFRQIDPKYA